MQTERVKPSPTTAIPMVSVTYVDSESRNYKFAFNLTKRDDRDKLIRTLTWAALSNVTVEVTPLVESK